ncbi:hypothetical protein [Streptomyces sp. NPDC050485]|uniref:hypothetical protein n=1 Tax=Streptomyces sp. NPDC050485 TaxID=3365617 RepID=UPI003793628D
MLELFTLCPAASCNSSQVVDNAVSAMAASRTWCGRTGRKPGHPRDLRTRAAGEGQGLIEFGDFTRRVLDVDLEVWTAA